MRCAKTAKLIDMSFRVWTLVGPMKHVIGGGSHWHHLANTNELSKKVSMQGGDADFL